MTWLLRFIDFADEVGDLTFASHLRDDLDQMSQAVDRDLGAY